MTPELVNVWAEPRYTLRRYEPHATRAAAVEELGEAVLERTAHRYLGTLLVTAHPTLGTVVTATTCLMAEAHEYARQSEAEAADRRRRVA